MKSSKMTTKIMMMMVSILRIIVNWKICSLKLLKNSLQMSSRVKMLL